MFCSLRAFNLEDERGLGTATSQLSPAVFLFLNDQPNQ